MPKPPITIGIIVTFMFHSFFVLLSLWLLFLANFLYKFRQEVFQWGLNDSKYPQVSESFANVLADLNNSVVCMILIQLQVGSPSSLYSKFFLLLWHGPSIYLSFHTLFFFYFVVHPNDKIHKSYFPLLSQYYVWSSGWD